VDPCHSVPTSKILKKNYKNTVWMCTNEGPVAVRVQICPGINNHSKDEHSFHQLFLSNWVNDIFDNVNGEHLNCFYKSG